MRFSYIFKLSTLALLFSLSTLVFTGCSEDEATKAAKAAAARKAQDDAIIDKIKKSAFPLYKSRTWEQVVNSNLKNVEWSTYTLGERSVWITGIWNKDTVHTTKRTDTGLRRAGAIITETTFCNPGNKITVKIVVKDDQTVEFRSIEIESDKNDLGSWGYCENEKYPAGNFDHRKNNISFSDERILALFE